MLIYTFFVFNTFSSALRDIIYMKKSPDIRFLVSYFLKAMHSPASPTSFCVRKNIAVKHKNKGDICMIYANIAFILGFSIMSCSKTRRLKHLDNRVSLAHFVYKILDLVIIIPCCHKKLPSCGPGIFSSPFSFQYFNSNHCICLALWAV